MTARRLCTTLALLALTTQAVAHTPPAPPMREMMRIQGYLAKPPAGVTVERQLTLVVFGESLAFAANEYRSFAFHDPLTGGAPEEPKQYTLQGDRPLLRRISTAKPGQQVTILAERRAGMTDLFVLAVDRCPP